MSSEDQRVAAEMDINRCSQSVIYKAEVMMKTGNIHDVLEFVHCPDT